MSFFQNALQWITEEAFPIVFIFCCIIVAYLVYAGAFRKRILPPLLNRRVKELLLTPSSATRKAYDSGSRPAATSGSRSVAPSAESGETPPARPAEKAL